MSRFEQPSAAIKMMRARLAILASTVPARVQPRAPHGRLAQLQWRKSHATCKSHQLLFTRGMH